MNFTLHLCAIDDDIYFLDVLEIALEQLKNELQIPIFLDVFTSFQKADLEKSYDLFLLDIEMPDHNGFDVADQIHRHYDGQIVFVTSIEDYVFQSFKHNPYGFIRKTQLLHDLKELIQRYHNEHEQKISIYYDYHDISIPGRQIERITVQGNSIIVHTDHRNYESRISLKKFMKDHPNLEALDFIQVNQSCIVNMNKIIKADPRVITMESGTVVELSRRYAYQFKVKYYTR